MGKNNRGQSALLIIIVNWNTKNKLKKCLDSVKTYIKSDPFEVLVIDNNSNDGSIEMLKDDYKHYKLIFNKENLGFAAANNIGFKKFPNFEYYLLLNSDAEINSKALNGMIHSMEKDSNLGLVGPALIHENREYQIGGAGFGPHWINSINTFLFLEKFSTRFKGLFINQKIYKNIKTPIKVTWLAFACTLVRKKMLDEIGYFNESFFVYGEDSDLCWRAIKKNWKVLYLPQCKIVHFLGGSSKDKGRLSTTWFKNLAYSIQINGSKFDYNMFVLTSILGYLMRYFYFNIKIYLTNLDEDKKLNIFYYSLFKASIKLKLN